MNPELSALRLKANNLPLLPGVYIMLDEQSKVIYVGKAKKLKNRVSSYFHGEHLPKVAAMADKVRDFNVIVVSSEFEALILENSLIKRHKPYYNILLKDDKGYPFVRLNKGERYPRLTVSPRQGKDSAVYYGPFGSRKLTKQIISTISKALLLPDCTKKFPEDIGRDRPCLNYHLGICEGWCLNDSMEEEYNKRIQEAVSILEGRSDEILTQLQENMEIAASEYRFEAAAKYRDRIHAIEGVANQQHVSAILYPDIDVFYMERGALCCLIILHYIKGELAEKETFIIDEPLEEDSEAMTAILMRYYSGRNGRMPKIILLGSEPDGKNELENYFSSIGTGKVSIEIPQRGERKLFLEMAKKNAQEEILRRTSEEKRIAKVLEILQKYLMLSHPPIRIESFDVSNLGNSDIVAGMVVLKNGRLSKKDYRKFRIKTTAIQNDYASMYEAVYRRFKEYSECSSSFCELPDVLLIDGGSEHAAVALEAVNELGYSLPVFGMVKDDKHKTRALVTADGHEIGIQTNQMVYAFIGTIQEETHRFTIEYQRKLRYNNLGSELDNIPGIGEKRKAEIFRRFKTMKAVKNASLEELEKILPQKTAEELYKKYHGSDRSE